MGDFVLLADTANRSVCKICNYKSGICVVRHSSPFAQLRCFPFGCQLTRSTRTSLCLWHMTTPEFRKFRNRDSSSYRLLTPKDRRSRGWLQTENDDDGGGPLDAFPIDGIIDSPLIPSHLFQIITGFHCRSESHRSATVDNQSKIERIEPLGCGWLLQIHRRTRMFLLLLNLRLQYKMFLVVHPYP